MDPDGNHPTEILRCHVNPHHDPGNAARDAQYRNENAIGGMIVGGGLIGSGLFGSMGSRVVASSRILSWEKDSTGHLIKHRDVLGYGSVSAQQAQKMLPQLRAAANQLLNNANPALTRVGNWNTISNARFYISRGKMLVTRSNGEFLTTINKTSNKWYKAAKPLKKLKKKK